VTRGSALSGREEWAIRRERGSVPLIRLVVWIALRLGRPTARAFLAPVCAYFLLFAPRSRAASRSWLVRVLGRPPTARDLWRHFWYFATCVLDRVLLLNDRMDLFEINLNGVDLLTDMRARHGGAFLFGAHLGSFEAVRAVGRALGDDRISLVMYENNARKTNLVLNAINPKLAIEIIGLGRAGAMMSVRERLDQGHLIGVLADRGLNSERQAPVEFFGRDAHFPVGPFRLAAILNRPVVFMVGLYRGGARYDIHFELIADPAEFFGSSSDEAIEKIMQRYVARLEHYCRLAPYNWFNFYGFW
jgi:predicted LPLAT superfamily acyltransferase